MSFTSPTPPTAACASTWAALIALAAALNEVTNPKLWPMKGMSLSMVFGIPMTPICRSRSRRVAAIPAAPRIEPSPPTTNKMSIP